MSASLHPDSEITVYEERKLREWIDIFTRYHVINRLDFFKIMDVLNVAADRIGDIKHEET